MTSLVELMRKIIFFWFFLSLSLIFNNAVYSQTSPDVPKINIPTSPEAALLGRFGDIPIGYYTGTANVSIPLYSVKEGTVEIPIALSYHGSGIKVEDQATWVGLGWDLSPEGIIIQEIRGKADEDDNTGNNCTSIPSYATFRQRFEYLTDNTYGEFTQFGRETAPNFCMFLDIPPPPLQQGYQDPYCGIDELLRGYKQPDIYSYNFGGYSGKFYIHPETHQVVIITKNEHVFIEKTSTNNINITTLDGTIYSFGVVETAYGGMVNEYTGKAYKISNIALLNGKTIAFTYTDNQYVEKLYSESANINNFTTSPSVSGSISYTTHLKKTLSRITSTDAIIDFNLESRDDINVYATDNVKRLKSLDITSRANNKKIKTIQFSYSYFPYDYTGVPNSISSDPVISSHIDAFGKRLKLESVKEIGYDDNNAAITTKPPYLFEYDMSVTMPLKVSYAKDFWGYFNGEQNQTLLPNLDYFDYFNQPDYKVVNQTLSYPYTGGNRYSDNSKAGAYMLKKITYPTTGYSEFEYEPNSFTNQFIPDKSKNVYKNYTAFDNSIGNNNNVVVQFKLSKSTTLHFENRINNGMGNYNGVTPLTAAQMAGCYIKFYKFKMVGGSPQITPIKQWDLSTVLNVDFQNNGGKLWSEDLRVEFDADPDPTFNYQVSVYYPDNLNNVQFASIAGVTSQVTYYDDTNVDISASNQCGMRVKSVKNYTSAGNIASHKLIKYYDGKLLNRFQPLSVYKANDLEVSDVTNGNGFEYIAFYKKITASSSDFGTNGGNLIGYGKVEEIEMSQGVSNSGKKVFQYLNVENKTRQGCPNIPNLRNGSISSEEVYDNSNTKLTEKIYGYSYLAPFPVRYVGINVVKLSTGSKVPCGNMYQPTPYTTQYYTEPSGIYNGSEYLYNAYTINSEWSKLAFVTSNQYANGNVLSSTESYTYNTVGSIKTITTLNSKNEQLITKYFYPTDNLINSFADNSLTTLHNIGTPVITEKYNGIKLLTRQKTIYGSVLNAPTVLPQFFYMQNGTNAEERTLTVNSYDDKGNITEYTPENNLPVSFIWNIDKTLPIAKVENATYSQATTAYSTNDNTFRTNLPNARITTFAYKPLIGVSTITDINAKKNTYEYDGYGRLILIRDQDNNILKKICYNYYGQAENCTTPLPPPPNISITSTNNNFARSFTASYYNISTGITYSFAIPNLSGLQTIGTLPAGNYNLTISKSGNLLTYGFKSGCGLQTIVGISAVFNNISVSSTTCNSISIMALEM